MIRSRGQRIADTLEALARERGCWMAVGRKDGNSHLIPLTYCWDGERLVIATDLNSITVDALKRTGRARLSLPSTHDVVIIDATAAIVTLNDIDATTHQLFRIVAGFDPCAEPDLYVYVLLTLERIQAWRNGAELPAREIMRAGTWVQDT